MAAPDSLRGIGMNSVSRSTTSQVVGLIGWLALCYGAAFIGSLETRAGVGDWYQTLRKPEWTPPGWVIAVVWNILFGLMAVAAWLVWRRVGWDTRRHGWFVAQLILNVAWSGLFFTLKNPGAAFFELILLWLTVLVTAIQFWPVSRVAAVLLIPYLAWVIFAGYLNFTIWQMN
jgi:benzodiazapine receptor